MKTKEVISEISLGDYRKKAGMQKAQSQMGAMFAKDPEERKKNLSTFNKREKGLNRLKARDEKARKAAADKDMSDTIAQLPQLKDEYEQMKAKYKSLGGSNWQYADRDQNLTDREREARSMEGPMNNLWRRINAAEKAQKSEGVVESLDEGRSDYVGDAIEGLRMAKPGLEKEDFLDELYSYIDAEIGNRAAEAAFADKGSYDDWYDSYSDSVEENAGMLKVAKDDDQQTILQNPTTGVQTQIDKKNPNAPRLAQDDKGKLTLTMPKVGGAAPEKAPNLVGKDVQVSQMPEMVDIRRLAGL
jgi:hypothetical protein